MHVRSATIIELFDKENDTFILNDSAETYEFDHINIFGVPETLVLAVHYTMADDYDMDMIFEKAANWYRDYCNWEDRNINEDGF